MLPHLQASSFSLPPSVRPSLPFFFPFPSSLTPVKGLGHSFAFEPSQFSLLGTWQKSDLQTTGIWANLKTMWVSQTPLRSGLPQMSGVVVISSPVYNWRKHLFSGLCSNTVFFFYLFTVPFTQFKLSFVWPCWRSLPPRGWRKHTHSTHPSESLNTVQRRDSH